MPRGSFPYPYLLTVSVSVLAIALVATPVQFDSGDLLPSKSIAFAKGGGGGDGGGDGNDGDRGGGNDGDRGGGNGGDKGGGNGGDKGGGKSGDKGGGKGASSSASSGTNKGGGHAFGRGGHTSHNTNASAHANARGVGHSVHTFTPAQTEVLVGSNWKSANLVGPGFNNHGHRVSTMVELAKALGFGARVGAMQANFGTLQELGIDDLQADVTAAEAAVAVAQAAL